MGTMEYTDTEDQWDYVTPHGSNVLVMLFILVAICWAWRLVRHVVKISELAIGIHTNQLMFLDTVDLRNNDLDLLSRNHLRQLISATRASPAVSVPQIHASIQLHKPTLSLIESSDKKKLGVSFRFDSTTPCVVDTYWGVKASQLTEMKGSGYMALSETAVTGLRHRRDEGGAGLGKRDTDKTGAAAPKKKKQGFLSQLVGGATAPSHSYTTIDIEMQELEDDAESSQGHAAAASNIAPFFDATVDGGERGDIIAYGQGGDHVYVSTEEKMTAKGQLPFLDKLYGVEGGTYPLVLVFRPLHRSRASRAVGSSCMLLVVDFVLRAPVDGPEAAELPPVTVWRKYIFSERACMEVQDIYGLQDSTSPECVVCLTDDKDVMLLPCRHLCVCHGCFKRIDKCPVCRSPFDAYSLVVREGQSGDVAALDDKPPHQ